MLGYTAACSVTPIDIFAKCSKIAILAINNDRLL